MAKIRVGLRTDLIDNRTARGTALVGRKFLEQLHRFEDRFHFTLVHSERTNDPLYTEYEEILMPASLSPFGKQMESEIRFWTQRALSRAPRFDIFHYLHPRVWPSYMCARTKKILVNAWDGGLMVYENPSIGDRLVRLTNRYLHQRMDLLIAASESGKREIVEAYRVPPEIVRVVPLGGIGPSFRPIEIDRTLEQRINAKYGIRRPYILSVGRFDPHKNIKRLLDAYAIFRQTHPHIRLLLVGGRHTPDYSDMIERRIAEMNSTHSTIDIAPYIEDDDMSVVYSGAHAVVFASLREGFGLPLVEAFATGVPVAASNRASLPEIAGDAALLFDPEQTDAIARALGRIVDDEVLRNTLRERGFSRVPLFTWEKMAEGIIAVYEELSRARP